jgi:hypothetical protein
MDDLAFDWDEATIQDIHSHERARQLSARKGLA